MSASELHFVPVSENNSSLYLEVGMQSYREHYLHLWKDSDPSDYFDTYFTEDAIQKELLQDGLAHYILQVGHDAIGIVKLNDLRNLPPFPESKTLLLEKIYLLRNYSGKGYGTIAMARIQHIAKSKGKRWLWLDTMQKGRARNFYINEGFEIVKETQLHYPNAIDAERPMIVFIKDLEEL